MSDILDFEVWTLPTSPTFEKKFDIKPLEGGTGTVGLSEYGDGSMHLPRFHPRLDEIVSDTKRSWIVVKKDGTIIDEFKADRTRKPVKRPSAVTVTGRQRNGLIEGIGVYPKEDREDAQDWKWGFENILPPLGLEDLGNVREEWKLYNDQTAGGTFTVTVEAGGSSDTTESLDFDISADGLEGSGIDAGSGLQGLSTVDDVTVSGEGTEDDPWIITFYNPPDPTNVSVTDADGLTSTLDKTVEGGLDPDPVTISKPVDQGTGSEEDHGEYDEPALEVVTDAAFVNTGSDYAVKCNAVSGFAGEQIAPLDVIPGETYSNLKIPVYPTKTGSYVIVVRDIFGGRIARKIVSLTAGSYQDLTIDKATIPAGVNQVIYRVAYDPDTTGDTDADPFYVDWQGATFVAGEPEATFTEIVRTLLEDAQSRGTATFLELDATDAADTNGTALSATSFTAFVGDNSHMGHVMADGKKSGYHWRIVNAARANAITPDASTTHVLQVFFDVDGEIEDTTGDDEAPYVYATAGLSDAETAERTPPYTVLLGLGSGTLKVEDTNASEVSGEMGRVERVVDVEHLGTTEAVQQFLDAQFAEEENNRKAARAVVLGTANMIPGVDYGEGSKIWWHFPGQLAREARVVRRFTWTHGKTARFEVQGSEILTPEDAQAKALDHLLNQLRRRGRGGGRRQTVSMTTGGQTTGAHIHVKRETTQSIAAGGEGITWTAYDLIARKAFGDVSFPTTAITIQEPGYYNISVGALGSPLKWASYTGGGTVQIIRIRGGSELVVAEWSSGNGQEFSGTAHAIPCESGDQIKVNVDHGDASSQDLAQASLSIYLVDRIAKSISASGYREMILADGPIAYWRLGETSGTTAVDETGNGHDGTYDGSPTLGANALILDPDSAVEFDRTVPQSVQVSDHADFDITEITLEAWINTSVTPADDMQIISRDNGGTNSRAWQLRINETTGFVAFLVLADGNSSALASLIGSTDVRDGATHHVVLTYDGTDAILYIDGTVDASDTLATAMNATDVQIRLAIRNGTTFGDDPYTGRLDEVVLYGRVLGAAEVSEHYQTGISGAS